MSIYYHQLTSPEIKEAAEKNTLILLPVGQVEEHGPHLPLECDCIIARETARVLAEEVSGEIPVLVMPTVWTAYSVKQVSKWPGLITFREPETMIQMIYDLLASLVENGFKNIIVVTATATIRRFLNLHPEKSEANTVYSRP